MTIKNVTIYLSDDAWCYAAWGTDIGEAWAYDHSDVLPDAESEGDARLAVLAWWPTANVVVV